MSNSKVRKALEEQSVSNKILEAYKKKADLLLNYQMCKAYYKDSAMSMSNIVDKILREKYDLPWQAKIIRKALNEVQGKTDAIVSIPKFKYEKKMRDIMSDFVMKNFKKMVVDSKINGLYPFELRDIIEKYSS